MQIDQNTIINYVQDCFLKFKDDFLEGLTDLEGQKDDFQNYTNLFNNLCHSSLVKNMPCVDALLLSDQNYQLDFAAKASFVSMRSDYNIKCNEFISKNIEINF